MSRYATLMEPSTAPPTSLPEAAAKHAPEAPVVPLASLSVTQTGITSAPSASAPNPALREPTDGVEREIKPTQVSREPANGDVSVENLESSLNRMDERSLQRSTGRTTRRMVKRNNVETNERTRIRHTFDILDDQLLTLREISIERQKMFGRRVLLGELVQEALDLFITRERNTG